MIVITWISDANEENVIAESIFGWRLTMRDIPFEMTSTERSIARTWKNAVRKRYLNG